MCLEDMTALIYYPFYLLLFWYKDIGTSLISFFVAFNRYVALLLSFRLLSITFFRPLKNEYRKGLVGFSIIMGIFIKSFLLLTLSIIFIAIFCIEIIIFAGVMTLPVILIYLLFR